MPVLRSLLQRQLAYSQVTVIRDFDEALRMLLSGPMLILVDGEAAGIVVDTRWYPDRTPSMPNTEQVVHGPQDGFVENIIMNTALIRRRIRQPGLRFELTEVGRRSKTDVAVAYIDGLTDPALVERVKRRLQSVEIDGIPMAEQPVAELLGGRPWNPFPTVRMTERPDVAATELLDGHVVVVTDTTPVAISCPVSLFQLLQHPEDYHVSPTFGTYLRWVEFLGILLAVLVPPVWLLLATHPGLLRLVPALAFVGVKTGTALPLALQFLLAEGGIDILRRAILNSPPGLATTFGILGAVIFGQVATKVGLFTPEALLYMVAAAIASFAISNIELGDTSRMTRISLLVLTWLWALPGLVVGLLFWLILAARTDSLGLPYLWPVAPWNWLALRSILIREPVFQRAPRPAWLHPRDRWRGAP
jgi:stage V sporulation protein AF